MDPKQEALEKKMSELCKVLDNYLEDLYGSSFSRHPNRPKRGSASNPCFDGLFSTTMSFTLGYGSKTGRGYLVNIDTRTLEKVPENFKTEIRQAASIFITQNLDEYFPGRKLKVVTDGNLLKLVGDFSLG